MKWLTGLMPLIALLAISFTTAGAAEVGIEAQPAWVMRHKWQQPADIPQSQISDGIYYVMLDRQVNVGRRQTSRFVRVVKKVLTPQGVEKGSQLHIDFDPSYERLIFHRIRIHRSSRAIDQLQLDKINIIQRESDLERRLYNGEKTASIILEDTRPGDCIEYAYTVTGSNPVFKNRYMDKVDTAWSVPLAALYYRWIFTNGRPVYNKVYGSRRPLEQHKIRNGVAYEYIDKDVAPLLSDNDLPDWYMPYPRIQISQFTDWADVARWGTALYQIPQSLPAELQTRIRELDKAGTSTEKIARALCLVQNEIRYLGIEIGAGSYKPTAPEITYARKFGDCKAKSILLCTLLNKLGIDARPALVNTYLQGTLTDQLPSPLDFNHVVVRLQDQGRTYWLDPTADCQTVPLDQQYQALYGQALVLDKNSSTLTATGEHMLSVPEKEIQEEYDLTQGVNRPAVYTVKTIFRGREADRIRYQLDSSGLEKTAKSYLNFYASDYPSVTERRPIAVDDQSATNTITITEYYQIPDFWEPSDDRKSAEAEVTAREFYSLLDKPKTTIRTMPMGLAHPQYVTQRTIIKLPEPWDIKPSRAKVENEAVAFEYASTYARKQLTLNYEYRTKQDFVPAEHTAAYLADLDRIGDRIGYSLTWAAATDQTSWFIVGAIGVGGILALVLGFAGWRYDPPAALDSRYQMEDPTLIGLGGWLSLVGLGLFVRPLVFFGELARQLSTLKAGYWSDIFESAKPHLHTAFKLLVGCEITANVVLLGLMLLLPILFFQKRTSFPNLFIAITLAQILVPLIGTAANRSMLAQSNSAPLEGIDQTVRAAVFAVIWSLYMIKSIRVRQTFQQRRGSEPLPVPAAPLLEVELVKSLNR